MSSQRTECGFVLNYIINFFLVINDFVKYFCENVCLYTIYLYGFVPVEPHFLILISPPLTPTLSHSF